MKNLKLFLLPFSGLKLGKHEFIYEIDDSFFNEFEYSIVKKGKLQVHLTLEKQETMLILNFEIKGSIDLNCDKCLALYPSFIDTQDKLIAKFVNEEIADSTDEVIVLNKNESEIDISSFIYEMITLAVPYVSICNNPGNLDFCDKEMLDKLAKLSANENEDNEVEDPRWDALKNIIKNN